jgi:hypothetical protein
MWFHLELAGQGYSAAQVATCVADKITGPGFSPSRTGLHPLQKYESGFMAPNTVSEKSYTANRKMLILLRASIKNSVPSVTSLPPVPAAAVM